ncbi:MAG: glycoside hydrolase family 99-like domain-containing protein [Prolixibacteraceae bacterium]|nr:glycoside hydrolase family 99-like domain-containing protein [Prolixibacteraceae bacterium]
MNYILISHCDLSSNSGIHIKNIAIELIKNHFDCVVFVPNIYKETKDNEVPFKLIEFGTENVKEIFKNNLKADIIHAFTPREHVRKETERLSRFFQSPYVVHLEDNEEIILKKELNIRTLENFENVPLEIIKSHVVAWRISPRYYKSFLKNAIGITGLIKKLSDFNFGNKPFLEFWPGFENEYLNPKNNNIASKYKLPKNCKFLVYTGSVHDINVEEFKSFLFSVYELNRRGHNVKLIKTGNDSNDILKRISNEVSQHVINLSFVEREDLPNIVHFASVLIQPGCSDDFNDYRFPSKLPEFFATGKPVILPNTNIGLHIKDFKNGILLFKGHYREIADKVEWVFNNPEKAKKIGLAGKKFAIKYLSWKKNVKLIINWIPKLINQSQKNISLQTNIQTNTDDIRLIAFYLPQFHTIPENDKWWGKGFTEWINVKKAFPVFKDHYQPKTPSELGYYNLSYIDIIEKQSELASYYGIFGFCYYYYWFSGKKLLEKPLNNILNTKKPASPFCICWANENWTRRWDGLDQEILIEQKYEEGWHINFFNEILPILKDYRYIKIDNKPLLLIYRIDCIPDSKRIIGEWKVMAKNNGLNELHIAGIQYIGMTPEAPISYGADASVEFPPHMHINDRAFLKTDNIEGLDDNFDGYIEDYKQASINFISREPSDNIWYRTLFPSWDNTARRGLKSHVYKGSTPELYKEWLSFLVDYSFSAPKGQPIIFINAWNEWAEGAYLEPDKKYGRKYLEATCEAIHDFKPIFKDIK